MFHLLINFKQNMLWVYTDQARKSLLVKFDMPEQGWSREGLKINFQGLEFTVKVAEGDGYYTTKLSGTALELLTKNMTVRFMSPAYQLKSPRGKVAFLKAVGNLLGNGKMTVNKVKREGHETIYVCKLYNKRGTAAVTEFNQDGTVSEKDFHSKAHKAKFLSEFTVDYKTYRKAAAFKQVTRAHGEQNNWTVHI